MICLGKKISSCQFRRFAHPARTCSRSIFTSINPTTVPEISEDDSSTDIFKSLLAQGGSSRPFRLKNRQPPNNGLHAKALMRVLREEEERIVDVEVGNYNDREFTTVSMRLGQYLHWLEEGNGTVGGSQVYLAQWRAEQDIPGVRKLLVVPRFMDRPFEDGSADLYQRSFFIGPRGAVTPLHYDPYENLFHMQATSSPHLAKHFLLLPPGVVKQGDGRFLQKNTSNIKFALQRQGDGFGVTVEGSSSQAIQELGLSCVLKEGETLFVPRGWWHRVENVWTGEGDSEGAGWTAGVGWWFRVNCGT